MHSSTFFQWTINLPQQGPVYKVMFTCYMNHHLIPATKSKFLSHSTMNHMLPWGHFDQHCDHNVAPAEFKKKKKKPDYFCICCNGATCHEITCPVVKRRCCTADTESTGLLTDAYLTSNMFKVLYFYVSNSDCNPLYAVDGFLYIFLRLSVPWWVFHVVFFCFFLQDHFDNLKFSLFFYCLCKV